MTLEPIGIATLLLGLLCLRMGQHAAAVAFLLASLLGAAAAVIIGAANIQPGHVTLGFAALASLTRRQELAAALRAMAPFQPGFWLACLVIYAIFTAMALPRLFAGASVIVPIGAGAYEDTGSVVPLGPVSGNVTQSIYMAANLLCFVTIAAIAASPTGFRAIFGGFIAYAIGNVAFAFIDLGTFVTGTQDVLGFMRNAQYTLHVGAEIGGLKRLVGSFTEASTFARSTLGALGFIGTLFICGYRPLLTGPLAAVLLVMVVMSTSSAGLAGAPLMVALLYATAMMRSLMGPRTGIAAITSLVVPVLALVAVLAIALSPKVTTTLYEYLQLVLLDKPESDSAAERGMWNAVALQNFFDSNGIGVGLGTGRSSSFALALISGVGVVGTLFYLGFALTAFAGSRGERKGFHANARLAARNACFGLLMGDLMVGTTIDQGLLFYALAALAASAPDAARGPARDAAMPVDPVSLAQAHARRAARSRPRPAGAPGPVLPSLPPLPAHPAMETR